MEIGIAKDAEVADFHPEARQRIRHDRAVAAKFGDLTDQFDIGASARSGRQSRGQLGDGGQP